MQVSMGALPVFLPLEDQLMTIWRLRMTSLMSCCFIVKILDSTVHCPWMTLYQSQEIAPIIRNVQLYHSITSGENCPPINITNYQFVQPDSPTFRHTTLRHQDLLTPPFLTPRHFDYKIFWHQDILTPRPELPPDWNLSRIRELFGSFFGYFWQKRKSSVIFFKNSGAFRELFGVLLTNM